MADLCAEGKIRFYGVSARTTNDARAYLRAADSDDQPSHRFGDTLQVAYNLLDQEAALKDVFVEAYRQDWGLISRVPLASGVLSGKYDAAHYWPPTDFRAAWSRERLQETVRRVEALRFLVKPPVGTMAQAAIAFVLSQEAVSTAITGAKTVAHVEDNVRASDSAPLLADDLRVAQELYERGFTA
jgi:aryl-alcohol dehydrogenase-like predicted oxidoreductase